MRESVKKIIREKTLRPKNSSENKSLILLRTRLHGTRNELKPVLRFQITLKNRSVYMLISQRKLWKW